MKNEKIVVNDLLNYSNLKIVQNKDYFNFSLDSVLLPNFVHFNKKDLKILDICTGNAPIPLIMSTKCDSNIIGVEIQKEIYDLAVESVKLNNLEDRISLYNMDANEFAKNERSDSYDIITCNPPYFKINEETLKNEEIIKTNARHETLINIEQIAKIAKKLLKNNSSLFIVHRSDRFTEIINTLKNHNLETKRVRFIYPKDNMDSNMVLIEARKNGKPGLIVEKPLIAHNADGSYTKEVLDMFQ